MLVNIPVKIVAASVVASVCMLSSADVLTIHDDMNKYYEKMDESFTRLSKSSTLKSTSLNSAEKLFIKEMKKNMAYYVLSRVNSKGKVISEAVRGQKIGRPNSSVEREKWFQAMKKSKKPYYSISRDDDRGRYYLIWNKPILKNNNFIGAVTAKIDLWDSFYEFSNSIYYPFLIRLNNLSLFSHKWNNDFSYKEERLTVPGINRISVRYIPEKKVAAFNPGSDSLKAALDSAAQTSTTIQKSDTTETPKSAETPKKNPMAVIVIAIIVAIAGGATVTMIIISKNRRKAFLRELDDEE